MKPLGQQNNKIAMLEQWMEQAKFDVDQRMNNGERGPGYTYYYHDKMDHLVRLEVKYTSVGHEDPMKPGGFVNTYVQKGYRCVDSPELIDIVRKQQAETYDRLGVPAPWVIDQKRKEAEAAAVHRPAAPAPEPETKRAYRRRSNAD